MLQASVGTSKLTNGFEAGLEAAKAAAKELEQVSIIFAYFSCAYDTAQVLKGIKEVFADAPVIGNTSFTGIITKEGYVGGDEPFVGIMGMYADGLTVGTAMVKGNGKPYEEGVDLAKAAMAAAGKTSAPDYFYMAASSGEEEFYLKGISSIVGRIPFFGGSAADNSIAGEWKLYAGTEFCESGAAVAFFYDAPMMKNVFTGAYHETNDFGVITKIDGNRTLMEIDGVPALEKYAQWRGCSIDDIKGGNLLVQTVCSPLGVKDRLGDLIAIRHPMNGNDDLSMAIGNNLAEKTCIIRMEATVDELIEAVPKTLAALNERIPGKPLAYHLVHCGGRRAG
ncbi:MAG TPA: FIST N-terminal domain-containing protein, partial [Lachnospiraceae bacterium]|nr:FIST N-terminal domain-containing protein [Lachnospiraceae bacterium]